MKPVTLYLLKVVVGSDNPRLHWRNGDEKEKKKHMPLDNNVHKETNETTLSNMVKGGQFLPSLVVHRLIFDNQIA